MGADSQNSSPSPLQWVQRRQGAGNQYHVVVRRHGGDIFMACDRVLHGMNQSDDTITSDSPPDRECCEVCLGKSIS